VGAPEASAEELGNRSFVESARGSVCCHRGVMWWGVGCFQEDYYIAEL